MRVQFFYCALFFSCTKNKTNLLPSSCIDYVRPKQKQLRARRKSWGGRDGSVPMGYGASGNRGKFPADDCDPGVPELAGRIMTES